MVFIYGTMRNPYNWCTWISFLLILLNDIDCSKILCIIPIGAKSTFLFQEQIIRALVTRGHEVTVISNFPQKKKILNYTNVDVSNKLHSYTDSVSVSKKTRSVFSSLRINYNILFKYCKSIYENKKVQSLMNSEASFDLVIAEFEDSLTCILPLAFYFRAPVIGSQSSHSLFPYVISMLGNPPNPSYIPNIYSGFPSRMNFFQRLSNSWQQLQHYIFHVMLFHQEISTARQYITHSLPIQQLLSNISLIFTNEVDYIIPKPRLPNIVSLCGIHINDRGTLPKDIENFIRGAEKGVIYVSFGSIIKFSSFTKKQHDAFLNIFSALPYRILWKHDQPEIIENIPQNILVRKWFPQTDILAEENVKLFITNCGMLSLQEAIYYEKPVLGIPVFFDQFTNAAIIEELKIGLRISSNAINEEVLHDSLVELLTNKLYSEKVREISRIFKDRPMKPNETVIYWVEYVIRHKGAHHLKSVAVDLSFYQYLLFDVILFTIFILILSILLFYFILKLLLYRKNVRKPKRE